MQSELHGKYLGWGHKENRLHSNVDFLQDLILRGVIELDKYTRGATEEINHLLEVQEIFAEYQLNGNETLRTEPRFPYMELRAAMKKEWNKPYEIRRHSDLALEMSLMRGELSTAIDGRDRSKAEEVIKFLCAFSHELQLGQMTGRLRLVG